MERRKPVPGWESLYEVSDGGEVFSLPRTVRFADGRVRRYPAQRRVPHLGQGGYPKVTLTAQSRRERLHVHVLVAAAFIGPRPPGMEVCHGNGVTSDCRVANLRYDTRSGNNADRVKHGTDCRGERHPSAKLTSDEVRRIREAEGSVRHLAREFGVSPTLIHNVRRGKRWSHLKD